MEFKTLIIFFAGVGIGALGMRFYLKDKLDKEVKLTLEKINTEFEKEQKRLNEEEHEEIKSNEYHQNKEDIKRFKSETAKLAYDKFFEVGTESLKGAETMHPTESPSVPYLISSNNFATDRTLDKVTLTYYINADIVCEETEAVDDVMSLIGDEWRDHFHDEEEGVVYVRNENMGADYEIILDESDRETVKDMLGYST